MSKQTQKNKRPEHRLPTHVKRFDPVAPLLAAMTLGFILWSLISGHKIEAFLDAKSFLLIFGGLAVAILWQYNFSMVLNTVRHTLRTFLPHYDRNMKQTLKLLDKAILEDARLKQLMTNDRLSGQLLNDTIYLVHKGLNDEELENFLCLKLEHEQVDIMRSVQILQKMASLAPALGLFGTVFGLINLLQSLNDPSQIGSSMSLALLTTAYGAGISSFIMNPLAGRVMNFATETIRFHEEFLRKIKILVKREESSLIEGRIGRIA